MHTLDRLVRPVTQALRWLPLLVLAACGYSSRQDAFETPDPDPGSKGIQREEVGRGVGEQVPTPEQPAAEPASEQPAPPEPEAPQEQPTQTCWCFAWVHGSDHGTDCFMAEPACERARRRRGPSGDTRACERTEQPRCERTGWEDGRRRNLGPTRPTAERMLGRSLAQLRRKLGAPTGTEQGWHGFGLHVAIRFADGRAERVRVGLREGMTCTEAVKAEGFHDAAAPLRRSDGCEWPGISMRHRLDPRGRYAGRLVFDTATLEVWIRSR